MPVFHSVRNDNMSKLPETDVSIMSQRSVSPSYQNLSSRELDRRVDRLRDRYTDCDLCAHACGVDRTADELGRCRATDIASVSSAFPHYGEEAPLSGHHGSGTIFLDYCPLRCMFCQNWEISQEGRGTESTPKEIADMALHLQSKGCHNINFVTPTHFVPDLVDAVSMARDRGLNVPIVWNCGGFERADVIELLEDVVDIYMPDVKWADDSAAGKYSGAPGYWDTVREAIQEMHSQVGDLRTVDGIATQGVLIRHLVMPNHVENSKRILSFIAEELSTETYVNVMSQYRPAHRVTEPGRYEALSRRITPEEYREVIEHGRNVGLTRMEVDERLL